MNDIIPLAAIVAVVILATVTIAMFYKMTGKVLDTQPRETVAPFHIPAPTRLDTDRIESY